MFAPDTNTLALEEFESIDRITETAYWEMQSISKRIGSIKFWKYLLKKIKQMLFEHYTTEIYGIDKDLK